MSFLLLLLFSGVYSHLDTLENEQTYCDYQETERSCENFCFWGYEPTCGGNKQVPQSFVPRKWFKDKYKKCVTNPRSPYGMWTRLDFGLVNQYRQLKPLCKSASAEANSWLNCSGTFTYCQGSNLMFDFKEPIAMHNPLLHLGGDCAVVETAAALEKAAQPGFSWSGYILDMDKESKKITKAKAKLKEVCEHRETKPTLVVSRETIINNLYHVMTDIVNVYLSLHNGGWIYPYPYTAGANYSEIEEREPTTLINDFQILFVDQLPIFGPFELVWDAFTDKFLTLPNAGGRDSFGAKVRQLPAKKVCFDNLMFLIPSRRSFYYNSNPGVHCDFSALMARTGRFVLSRLGLGPIQNTISLPKIIVTIIERKGDPKHSTRNVENWAELVQELIAHVNTQSWRKGAVDNYSLPADMLKRVENRMKKFAKEGKEPTTYWETDEVVIRSVDMEAYSFRDQIKLVQESSVLAGVHGAGLAHAFWLPEDATVVELNHFGDDTYKNMVGLLALHYVRADPQYYHSTAPPKDNNPKLTNYRVDKEGFVDPIMKALGNAFARRFFLSYYGLNVE